MVKWIGIIDWIVWVKTIFEKKKNKSWLNTMADKIQQWTYLKKVSGGYRLNVKTFEKKPKVLLNIAYLQSVLYAKMMRIGQNKIFEKWG